MSAENLFTNAPVQKKDESAPFMVDPKTGIVMSQAEYKASHNEDRNNR